MNSLIMAVFLLSSGPWSLADCIKYALDHNLTVKQSEVTVQQREVELNTEKNRRWPGISASAGENVSIGRGLNSYNVYTNNNTASTSFGLGAQMPVFQGFEINKSVEMGKLNLSASTRDLEKVRDDIKVSVAQAYVTILYDQEILEVSRGQVAVDTELTERITAMKESGKASAAEVASQQATLAQSKLQMTQAENDLSLAILDLTQLLELESPEGFSIRIPSEEALGMQLLANPEEVYADAINVKAVVQAELVRLDYAKVNIEKAKSAYYPTLSLSGGLSTNYYAVSGTATDSFGTQLKNNFSPYLGLSLSIPIFQRMSVRNSVRLAKLSYTNQQLQLDNTKKNLYKEIQQVYYNAVAAQAQQRSSFDAAESARQSFILTKEKYENGKANITEYNEAKNRYLSAESDYLQARYKCVFQTKLLDFYRGVDLSL